MAPKLNAIGIVVADMARSLAFYRLLGLDIPAAADSEPHVERPAADGVHTDDGHEDTIRSFDPDWTPPSGGNAFGLAFECDRPAEVDRVYADADRGRHEGHKEPWDAFWGQRYAVLHDPDGNGVDLYALADRPAAARRPAPSPRVRGGPGRRSRRSAATRPNGMPPRARSSAVSGAGCGRVSSARTRKGRGCGAAAGAR